MTHVKRRLVEQGRNARPRRRHHGADDALDRLAVEAPSVVEPLDPVETQRHGLAGQGGSAVMSKNARPTGSKPGASSPRFNSLRVG